MKIWAIQNTITKTFLRNNLGVIPFFMTHAEAQNYIDANLPSHLWDVVEYRR